jgi:hypothetical protein
MTRTTRFLMCALVALSALAGAACDEDGIGVRIPEGGARWGSGGPGPDIVVAGGPVYR